MTLCGQKKGRAEKGMGGCEKMTREIEEKPALKKGLCQIKFLQTINANLAVFWD